MTIDGRIPNATFFSRKILSYNARMRSCIRKMKDILIYKIQCKI